MIGTPFLLGEHERAALQALRELAAKKPVEMRGLVERLRLPKVKTRHMRQMTAQTVELPFGWTVTLSIETGHSVGVCRHMSMASPNPDRVPLPEVVWMIAAELGFVGDLTLCAVWPETLSQGVAINVVQPVTAATEEGRA